MSERNHSEIELKLVLPGLGAESAVVKYLLDHHYTVEELDPVRNVDTYLDTFDWSLMKNKLSLRYRISNGSWMYTLKSIGHVEDGIARRTESRHLPRWACGCPNMHSRQADSEGGGRDHFSAKTP